MTFENIHLVVKILFTYIIIGIVSIIQLSWLSVATQLIKLAEICQSKQLGDLIVLDLDKFNSRT